MARRKFQFYVNDVVDAELVQYLDRILEEGEYGDRSRLVREALRSYLGITKGKRGKPKEQKAAPKEQIADSPGDMDSPFGFTKR